MERSTIGRRGRGGLSGDRRARPRDLDYLPGRLPGAGHRYPGVAWSLYLRGTRISAFAFGRTELGGAFQVQLALAGSGARAQPHPHASGVPLDVDLRQHLVIAEGAAEQAGGDDRHALGAQPATLDVGAMHADERGDRDAQEAAEGLGLPANGGQGAVQAVVVMPDQPIGAL